MEKEQEAVQALCERQLALFKEREAQWYQNDQQYKVPCLCASRAWGGPADDQELALAEGEERSR